MIHVHWVSALWGRALRIASRMIGWYKGSALCRWSHSSRRRRNICMRDHTRFPSVFYGARNRSSWLQWLPPMGKGRNHAVINLMHCYLDWPPTFQRSVDRCMMIPKLNQSKMNAQRHVLLLFTKVSVDGISLGMRLLFAVHWIAVHWPSPELNLM